MDAVTLAAAAAAAKKLASEGSGRRALDAVRDSLAYGDSTVIMGFGDSTIAGSTGVTKTWLRRWADLLAAKYPTYRVRYKLFNVGSTVFDDAVVQASPAGDRRVVLPGATASSLYAQTTQSNAIATGLDVAVDLALTTYASGSNQAVAAQFGSSGSFGWVLFVGTTGLLNLIWSRDGTGQLSAVSTANLSTAVSAGGRIWVRATLNPNSSGSSLVNFYTSTDGTTWTSLGSQVSVAAAGNIFTTNRPVEVGGYNNGNTWLATGSIYEARVRGSIGGPVTLPTLPDQWSAQSTSTHTVAGSPTIDVYAAAAGGYSVSSLNQYFNLMCPPLGQHAILVDCLINQGFQVDQSAWTQWNTLLASMRAVAPQAALGMVLPNPERQNGGVSQTTQDTLRRRSTLAKGFAQQNSMGLLDVRAVFLAQSDYTTFMQDDRHPNDAGHQLWANFIHSRL